MIPISLYSRPIFIHGQRPLISFTVRKSYIFGFEIHYFLRLIICYTANALKLTFSPHHEVGFTPSHRPELTCYRGSVAQKYYLVS